MLKAGSDPKEYDRSNAKSDQDHQEKSKNHDPFRDSRREIHTKMRLLKTGDSHQDASSLSIPHGHLLVYNFLGQPRSTSCLMNILKQQFVHAVQCAWRYRVTDAVGCAINRMQQEQLQCQGLIINHTQTKKIYHATDVAAWQLQVSLGKICNNRTICIMIYAVKTSFRKSARSTAPKKTFRFAHLESPCSAPTIEPCPE